MPEPHPIDHASTCAARQGGACDSECLRCENCLFEFPVASWLSLFDLPPGDVRGTLTPGFVQLCEVCADFAHTSDPLLESVSRMIGSAANRIRLDLATGHRRAGAE